MKKIKSILLNIAVINSIIFSLPFGEGWGGAFCQDVHFSQYSQTPLLVNPALTGAFNGNHRAIVNFKDQWKTATNGSPYRTYAFSYDAGLFKEKWENSFLGAGLSVFSDKAGDTEMGITQANISLASFLSLNESNMISVGLQGGFAQRSINNEKLRWSSQYVNGVYDPTAIPAETLSSESFGFGDVSAGVNWNYRKPQSDVMNTKGLVVNLGAGFFHVNKPKQKFYSIETEQLYSKFSVYGNVYIELNSNSTALLPSVLYFKQGPTQEFLIGTYLRYTLKDNSDYTGIAKQTALSIGGYLRAKDAFIPAVMLEVANFAFGVTYDINTSDLNEASKSRGGLEISVRYVNPNPFKSSKKGTTVKFM